MRDALLEIAERDPLALLLAGPDGIATREHRDAVMRHVQDDYRARAEEVAGGYRALAAGMLADVSMDDIATEVLESLTPGADPDPLLAARERVWWTAVASADIDGAIARGVRVAYDGILDAFTGAIGDLLAANGRRPRDGMTLGEFAAILGAITDGLTLRGRIDATQSPETNAMRSARVFHLLSEPDPEHRAGGDADADAEVRDADRRLAIGGTAGTTAMADQLVLLRAAQADDDALRRARLRSEVLLRSPDLRRVPGGNHAWRLAALTVGVLDGAWDAAVAEAATADQVVNADDHRDQIAVLRALVRLGRWPDVLREAERLRAAQADAVHPTVVALEAEAYVESGNPAHALRLLSADAGRGSAYTAAVGASALTVLGRLEEAAELLARPVPAAVGHHERVAQLVSTARLALAQGRANAAYDAALEAGDVLRRVDDRHPATGGWRLIAVRALIAGGHHAPARRLLDEHDVTIVDATRADLRHAAADVRALLTSDAGATLRRHRAAVAPVDDRHPWATPTSGSPRDLGLTPRVRDVALLLARGLRDAEIARELGLSPRTVNRHVTTALKATGTRNRTELAAMVLGHSSDDIPSA